MEISIDGIKVNKAKKVIYFLLALDPVGLTSIFNDLRTSIKIIEKRINNRMILTIRSNCRFLSLNAIKLLSINVKKVKKAKNKVIVNTRVIIKFFFIKLIIMKQIGY